jgi:hypothetical protein
MISKFRKNWFRPAGALAGLLVLTRISNATAAESGLLPGPVAAQADPAKASHVFVPEITPSGYDKSRSLTLHIQPGGMAILTTDGRFTPLGQYLYDLASDPKNVTAHFDYLFSRESGNWPTVHTPIWQGTSALIQGHRLPRLLPSFVKTLRDSKDLPPDKTSQLMDAAWVGAVEAYFHGMINAEGLLARGDDIGDMALTFHFMRSGFAAFGLHPERIYSLDKAQLMVRTLLTSPRFINPGDHWVPGTPEYIAAVTKQNEKTGDEDPTLIQNGQVFFTGGLFIGWKTARPSVHGTWDGLALLNTFFKYYPDADPASPHSIYYLWNQEPDERKEAGRQMMTTLQRQLWLNYQQNKGPSYCIIVNGKVAESATAKSEVPQLLDHASYTQADTRHWAARCWEEIYGQPKANTTGGVQDLIAILEHRAYQPAPSVISSSYVADKEDDKE